MEVGPVAGIRVVPAPRAQPADPEVTASFDIEALANNDTYTPSRKKAAGAEEADDEELDDAAVEDGEEANSLIEGDGGVSYFA